MTGQPEPRMPCGLMLLIRLTIRLTTLACCISLASCDQFALIAVVDSRADTGQVGHRDGGVGPDAADASSSEPPEQVGHLDGGVGSDAADASSSEPAGEPSDAGTDAGMPDTAPTAGNGEPFDRTNCTDRPVVAGCDPTVEGGCNEGLQCVIDYIAETPTGYCVFSTPIPPLVEGGGICFDTQVTGSCPPTFICYGGFCRELCLCDEDCSTGICCGEAVGAQGFRLCAEC